MENTSNPSNEQNGQRPSDNPTPRSRPFDAIGAAFRRGAEDARQAAEEAIPNLKAAACNTLYWASYGLSYAAVFQWTVAKAGSCEGVQKGQRAAEAWMERFKASRNADAAESVPLLTPPPQASSAGPA